MTVAFGSETGPTSKVKNCTSWGVYEREHSSEFSSLCNGGIYQGDRWGECPSRHDCRKHTYLRNRARTGGTTAPSTVVGRLPTTAPQRTSLPVVSGSAGITRRKKKDKDSSPHLESLYVDHSNGSHGYQSRSEEHTSELQSH